MTSDIKKILKVVLLGTFFIFIIFYAVFRSKELILGVKIRDVNIVDGTKVTESVMNVTGKAQNAIKLTLNGREISIDQEGNWSETIALSLGYNVINIRAEDKFGNNDEKNYQLIYSKGAE